ncbi:hypothetical protein K458DRAFT_392916 [Lentithecium fluviatile CBS 122367]|uniref:Adhesin domain-containing protein n=1 Tax=Lentithecium fluviatile CBS 122367 TaxID=1168545 RepID=A0A6G1IPT9_9PLEO|nr:hypothetical protein K458DRAFT_392916 [Lentithecium fluviatile CBS 122367]
MSRYPQAYGLKHLAFPPPETNVTAPTYSPPNRRSHQSVAQLKATSSSRWRDSDSASFNSTNTDPLSSPTNGYFANYGTLPDEMFIDTEAANKGGKPRVVVSAGSPSRTRYEQDATPLLETFVGQEAPPPSYLEATTPMPWEGRPSGDEAQRLLVGGRASFAPMTPLREEMHKDGKYRRRSFREHFSRRRMLKWVGATLALIVIAALIAALASKDKKKDALIPVPAKPAESGTPFPSKPKDSFPIRWPSRCGKDYNVQSEERSFGAIPDLNIVESVHQLDGNFKRVSGWIHVTQGPTDQTPGTIEMKMAYAVSASAKVNSIQYAWSDVGLVIGDPSFPDGFDGIRKGTACLGMSIVIYMGKGATLENFNIKSTHMGMQVHSGVDFSVTNRTSISLTTGTLDATSFVSRETHLETISGSISGKYSLLDLISISTKSGSVNVNIEPMEKASDGSETAIFRANSLSGSIRADFERKNIPERDYQVEINTTVGSVDGTFIHGSSSTFSSVAGMLNADILPFQSGDYASFLNTITTDGQTTVRLRAPYKAKGIAMNKLVSTHKSVSGILDLEYPQEWEGHVEGQSVSGSLHLQGKDLELIKQEEREGLNLVEAKKGAGRSTMMFSTTTGGCEVKVGRL